MPCRYPLKLALAALCACTPPALCACSDPDTDPAATLPPGSGAGADSTRTDGNGQPETSDTLPDMNRNILIQAGGSTFRATLDDSETGRAFAALLPMTVSMTELNGNEKYYDLPQPLPTASYRPGTIHAGDLLLWGSSTAVLFYETFSSPYSYTRIGRIADPTGLAEAVGRGNVTVTFEAAAVPAQ